MKLMSRIRNNATIKRVLIYLVGISLFFYVFTIPSFSETHRLAVYIPMVVLGASSVLYCFLFARLRLNKYVWFVLLFVVFSFISTAHNIVNPLVFIEWKTIPLLAATVFVFIYSFKAIRNRNQVISIISLALFAFSIYYVIANFDKISFSTYSRDDFSDLGNQNDIAAYSIIGVALSLYLVLFRKDKLRFIFIAPLLATLFVGVTTGSRTFFVILLFFVFVFIYPFLRKHKLVYFGSILLIIGLAVLVINLPIGVFVDLKKRLINGFDTLAGRSEKPDTAVLTRFIWFIYGFNLAGKHLLFGYGTLGFSTVSGVGTYSHSNYSELLCNFGIFGFLIFYFPLVLILFRAFKNKNDDKLFVVAFVFYYVLAGFTNVFYYKKLYYLVLALLYYISFEQKAIVRKSVVPVIKKILFTCDTMGSGGAEKVISLLANEMSGKGITVNIIGVGDVNEPHSFYKLNEDVKYITLKNKDKKRINPIKRVFLLTRAIKDIEPDVVVSFLPTANIYTMFVCKLLKIPYIVSERNNPKLDPKEKIIRIFKKMSFYLSSGCVFQTHDSMAYYSNFIQKKSLIIKNPIDVKRPSFEPPKRENVVLSVGRLTKQKNYYVLLDAFKNFNNQKENRFILKIYGDGNLKNDLINYCKKISISEYVVFAGVDRDWQEKEYNDAMFVLSSDYEGMPNSLAEAMSIGIPSISTDCPIGGARELIDDGVNGFLVPVNDPNALASRMCDIDILTSRSFFNNTANLQYDYSVESITNKWLDFIKGLSKEVYE